MNETLNPDLDAKNDNNELNQFLFSIFRITQVKLNKNDRDEVLCRVSYIPLSGGPEVFFSYLLDPTSQDKPPCPGNWVVQVFCKNGMEESYIERGEKMVLDDLLRVFRDNVLEHFDGFFIDNKGANNNEGE